MVHERHIPIDRLEVLPRVFDRIDEGQFPEQWQENIRESAAECEMPIPGWIFVNHWELSKSHRLWRLQWWRSTGIEWIASADVVDDFDWTVGDKLHLACLTVRRNTPPEICQHAGLILRDAWIEFSHAIRARIGEIAGQPGKNDVKAIVEALGLSEGLTGRARKAYDSTNNLQHDRKAVREKAEACFKASATVMAEIPLTRPVRSSQGRTDPSELSYGQPNHAWMPHLILEMVYRVARTARAFGLTPVTGAEVTFQGGEHVTLLAAMARGYGNLCRLLSLAHATTDRRVCWPSTPPSTPPRYVSRRCSRSTILRVTE